LTVAATMPLPVWLSCHPRQSPPAQPTGLAHHIP
jgi:hypothetical protein